VTHGFPLEFFCFDCRQRICGQCVRNQHKTHKFNFVNVCASINKEQLEGLRARAAGLQRERQQMHGQTLEAFKRHVRREVLALKQESIKAVEEACGNILATANKGELRAVEREMELFQSFFFHKIQNFNYRIKQATEAISRSIREEKYQEVMLEKDRVETFDQELGLLSDQIRLKRDYFQAQLARLKTQLDLSSFQQARERAAVAQRSLELFSKENRIAVFQPNKK